MSTGESSREVLIRLKLVPDRSANAAALQQTAKEVDSAQKQTDRALQDSVKAQSKAIADAERAKRKELLETNRRTVAIFKQQEREAKAAETAQKRAVSAHQQAMAKLASANDRVAEGFKQSLSGAMSLGRGIAMLGLVGEKDTEKLLRGLIKVQAGFDVLRGSVELVQGLTRAWAAYRAAILAAAAAHGVLTAAQASSTAGGIGGAIGQGVAGAAIGRSAAFAGRVGMAGLRASPYAAAAYGTARLSQAAGGGFPHARSTPAAAQDLPGYSRFNIVHGYSALSRSLGLGSGIVGGLQGDEDALQRSADSLRRRQAAYSYAMQQRAQAEALASQRHGITGPYEQAQLAGQFGVYGMMGRKGHTLAMGHAESILVGARGQYGGLRARQEAAGSLGSRPLDADVAAAGGKYLSAIDRVVKLKQEDLRIQREIHQEQIKGASDAIRGSEEQVRLAREQAALARGQGQSKAMQFALLKPLERSRLKGKLDRFRKGGAKGMSSSDLGDIYEWVGGEEKKRIGESLTGRGKEGGFKTESWDTVARKADMRGDFFQWIAKGMKEVRVTVQRNDDALVGKVVTEVTALLGERDRILQQRLFAALDESKREAANAGVGVAAQGAAAMGD